MTTAINYLYNVNMNKNELHNVVIQNLAVAPNDPKEGQIYYNTADKAFYIWNGTEWKNTIVDVQQGRDFTQDIETAKQEAKDYVDTKVNDLGIDGKLVSTKQEANTYTDNKISDLDVTGKLATLKQEVKTESDTYTDQQIQALQIESKIEAKVNEFKEEITGLASSDYNTFKEVEDAIKKNADAIKLIQNVAKKEKFELNNEPTGVHTVSHTLNTEDVIVSVYDTSKNKVITDVTIIDANTVRITVTQGTDLTGYEVVIVG